MHRGSKSRLTAFFRLTRIEHSIMLVIAVLAAEVIVGNGLPDLSLIALSFVAPIFISMGSFAINDYFDVAVDRANGKLSRPLVSGVLSKRAGITIAFVCFAIGVASSAFIGYIAFGIAMLFAVLAALYSYRLKEMLLVGNIYIAFAMAIPFLFGNFVVSNAISPVILLLSATVLASGFAREVHGTIRDYEGDKRVRNVKSVPSHIGIRAAAILAMVFYLIAIALSVWLFLFAEPFLYNAFYMACISVVDAMLIYVSLSYLTVRRSTERKVFSRTRNVSLLAMGLALLIYLASALIFI